MLSPDGPVGRILRNALTGESIQWQKERADEPGDLVVGRFVFDAVAFRTAGEWLDAALLDPYVREIILDEAGPLELGGMGWDTWIRKFLAMSPDHKTLLLVARESIVDELEAHYGLVNVPRIHAEDLA